MPIDNCAFTGHAARYNAGGRAHTHTHKRRIIFSGNSISKNLANLISGNVRAKCVCAPKSVNLKMFKKTDARVARTIANCPT